MSIARLCLMCIVGIALDGSFPLAWGFGPCTMWQVAPGVGCQACHCMFASRMIIVFSHFADSVLCGVGHVQQCLLKRKIARDGIQLG